MFDGNILLNNIKKALKESNIVEEFSEKERKLPTAELVEILKKDDYNERKETWNRIKNNSAVNLLDLAHPYYIGFGNPASDILIEI